ncbi:dynamin family protein [Rhodococcus aetherivorans]
MTTETSPLLTRIARLCHDVDIAAGPAVLPVIASILDSLAAPIRVAVVGRVNTGKSTLVNALIQRAVAPTRATECTRVVTVYRRGTPHRALMIRRDGSWFSLDFNTLRLPDTLPIPVSEIDHVVVDLPQNALTYLTLVDTPGLAVTAAHEERTRQALLSQSPEADRETRFADALLYLFDLTQHHDDVAFLRDLLAADVGFSNANIIGLLSRADNFGDGPWGNRDPIDRAGERARAMASDLSSLVATVVPVSGLLAETAGTGTFTNADARALADLDRIADTDLRSIALNAPPGVDPDTLARLVRLIGGYGIRHCRALAHAGSPAVTDWLADRSGIAHLRSIIDSRLTTRTHVLKASRALVQLRLAASSVPACPVIMNMIDQAKADPVLHPIAELRALEELQRSCPDDPAVAVLERLLSAADDRQRLELPPTAPAAALADEALHRASRARADAAFLRNGAVADALHVISRSYALIHHTWSTPG